MDYSGGKVMDTGTERALYILLYVSGSAIGVCTVGYCLFLCCRKKSQRITVHNPITDRDFLEPMAIRGVNLTRVGAKAPSIVR
jgi:hypothetical protein